MLLEGHEGDIFSVDFHPEGQYLASSGFDRQICKISIYLCIQHLKLIKDTLKLLYYILVQYIYISSVYWYLYKIYICN